MKALSTVRVDRYSDYIDGESAWFRVTHADGSQVFRYGTRAEVCVEFA